MKRILLLSACLLAGRCSFAKSPSESWHQQNHLLLIENKGQITDQNGHPRSDIQFRMETPEVNVLIGNASLHYQWQQHDAINTKDIQSLLNKKSNTYRMDVSLVGANPDASVIKEGTQPYFEKYYLAHLGLNGTIAHSYSKVTYQNVYPDIDWVIYANRDANGAEVLKYDFVVHPGGNAALIQLKYEGSTSLKLNEDGSLQAFTPMGNIKEQAPYSYSINENTKTTVSSEFQLKNNVLSFKLAAYKGTLIIDPSLEWATYYGGAGFDLGTVLTCDNSGHVYVTGASWMSMDIATVGSYQYTNAGDFDAFLAKFDSDGNRLWATYYGGPTLDYSFGLACDQHDRVYISGITLSTTGISTAGSAQATYAGGGGDDYLARFDSSGSLIWATYCGSSGDEYNGLCAADEFGHVYLTGYTTGNDNIYSNGHQSTNGGGPKDAFLVQYDTSGIKQWGTFYGGSGDDQGDGVACDRLGFVYMEGHTNSASAISTSGSHQPANGGGFDDFLVKFNSAGVRQWATYYGGTADENNGNMRPVACDKNNNVYISGQTPSTTGIATSGSYQSASGGGTDAFLVKFNSAGTRTWGTYYGGSGNENGGSIACDLSNNIFWCGFTTSTDSIATPGSHQTTFGGGQDDVFLTKFDESGNQIFGTYYGGNSLDEGIAVGFDNIGNAYISGGTASPNNIATPGSFSTTYAGGIAVFLAKFCTSVNAISLNGPDSICANSTQLYTTTAIAGADGYIWTIPAGWSGASDSNSISVTSNGTGGQITVKVIRCDTSTALQFNVYVRPVLPAVITANGFVLSTVNTHTSYQWFFNGQIINGAQNPTYTVTQNGNYTVVVTNPGGCTDTSDVFAISNVVAIQNVEQLKNSIQIYPNPANSILNILSPVALNINITGMDGRVFINKDNVKAIDISNLSNGVYMIRFTDKDGHFIKTEKFTKLSL
ncbi:DUF7948 domain-containing protein [Taibaiella lutea]|nr:T9SS type A sorting domain-containing protein [Taibaiella lutea]